MRCGLAWSKRLSALTLCAAFVAGFVLPCLCAAERPASHAGHCGDARNGLKAAMGGCCCRDLPAAAEAAAKLAPAPPGAPLVLDALSDSFLVVVVRARVPATPFRLLHGPPFSPVLRI